MTTDYNKYGSPRATMLGGELRSIITEIMRDNRDATDMAIINITIERVIGHAAISAAIMPAEHRQMAVESITNHMRAIGRYAPEMAPEDHANIANERVRAKAVRKQTVKAAIRDVFSFLNCVLPSGKLARHATAPELIEAGGIFQANGEKLHNKVGDNTPYGEVYDS
jgi:hypothetical protein